MQLTKETFDRVRACVNTALNNSTYIGKVSEWVISPTPDYFCNGGDPSFEICCRDSDGNEGDFIFIGSEWECYKVFTETFPELPVIRSCNYRYIC